MDLSIRRATSDDAEEIVEIYRPYVEDSVISFELEVPSSDEFAARIHSALQKHEWIVGILDQKIVGYAYGNTHRARSAYRHSVETSVYLEQSHCGRGYGRRLYAELFERLRKMDFNNAYAGITLPNQASVALHKSMGFQPIGVFKEIGFKFDQWHDVGWWQRRVNLKSD